MSHGGEIPSSAAAEKQEAEESSISLGSVFPRSKIKAHVLRDEGVGRLSNNAVDYIGACSAAFCQKLIRDSLTNDEKASKVLTLEMVQACVGKKDDYDFLRESVSAIVDDAAPKVDWQKTKRKRAPRKEKGSGAKKGKTNDIAKSIIQNTNDVIAANEPAIQKAIARAQQEPLERGGIVLDQDEYD